MSLADQLRRSGVVGAGGAGFPAYVKAQAGSAGKPVEFVIANGAECEPLLHKDSELMTRHAAEIVDGVRLLMAATGAARGIIGLKAKHSEAAEAFAGLLSGDDIQVHLLGDFYPTGDEYVLVYETTGRLIPSAGIPLDIGAVVQNVETLYNIAAAANAIPVTHKTLTIAGAVARPLTCRVPIGVSLGELVELAGGAAVVDLAMFVGGAMMGRCTRSLSERVTKTTGGIIVLPADHTLVVRNERTEASMNLIGKSACDQCSYCTELCPRYLLGHELQPHKTMRSLVFSMAGRESWDQWGTLCCECGLCTLYACPEDLYPREACQQAKRALLPQKGKFGPSLEPGPVTPHPMYESRRIPLKQLVQRLGLTEYDVPAPYSEVEINATSVRLPLQQHAGQPAVPAVKVGDSVRLGDLVADLPDDQLGAPIHASIDGTVEAVYPEIAISRK